MNFINNWQRWLIAIVLLSVLLLAGCCSVPVVATDVPKVKIPRSLLLPMAPLPPIPEPDL